MYNCVSNNLQVVSIPSEGMLQVISTPSLLAMKIAVILYSTMSGVSLMKESLRGTEKWVYGNIKSKMVKTTVNWYVCWNVQTHLQHI